MKRLGLLLVVMIGCSTDSSTTSISKAAGTNSHDPGTNCMGCHREGGSADSWFTAAGSLLTKTGTLTDAMVTITYSDGTTPPVPLEVDSLGNFFTTEDLGLPVSIVPQVTDITTGMTTAMPFSTVSATCNFCHYDSNVFQLN